MLVLHYAPDNASLIVRLALEEAGLAYRTVLVDRRTRGQDAPAYRAVNPTGLIPAVEATDGPVWETGAILLWLADRNPAAGLAPAPSDPGRGAFLSWLFFLSNTLHADLRQLFYADRFAGHEGREGHRRLAIARLDTHLDLVAAAVAAGAAPFAPPAAPALYLAVLMRWAVLYPRGQAPWFELAARPALAGLAAAVEVRPAARRAAAAGGLGPAPFTAPAPPRPPEGSPL